MAQNEQKTSLFSKLALVALALSFPVGLFILNAPAFKELAPAANKKDMALDINEVIETKSEEIAKIDLQILEARGQLLKFEEMKGSQLRELKTLYDRIAKLLESNDSSLNRPSEESK